MPVEEFLSKRYQKWDKFQDDSDDEQDVPRVPTQFDTEGEDDIVVSTELLLTPQQIDKFRKLDQPRQEVWQVVVRKLRVWSASSAGAADGADAIPCRPYCILVNNLYPLGQVISKKICDPPEVYPSPQTILDTTLHAMLDPPTNTPQHRPDKIVFPDKHYHRPDKIVFPDKHYVGQLRKSFAAIGIECSYLSESQGIDTYIQELSNHLVKNDLASVAEVSERPGLNSGSGVTPEILKSFYEACARRGTVFSSVIASPTSSGQIQGLALFFTRTDLERRVLPAGERLALMENPELRRCAFCDKKAPKGSELKRCTRCKCTFYCGAECQRSHWKDHKISCVPQSDVVEQADKKIVWGAKEMSILYGGATTVPFDDLDAVDKHSLPVAKLHDEELYPTAMVFKFGEPDIPTAADLVWLTRALIAHSELLEKHPLFMQATVGALLGLDEDENGVEQEQPKVEFACKTLGFDDHLVIRNSSVLTMQDVEKLRAYVKKQRASSETTKNDSVDATETKGATEETKQTGSGEEGSNCILM
ncbi:hypothetical protein ATCC90586_003781 [Pythium insidiosum]|nr:hypothetical protein ATCC90586_003781 [Pythium insidiosum]